MLRQGGVRSPGMKEAENCEEPFVSPDFSIRNAKLLDAILEQIERQRDV